MNQRLPACSFYIVILTALLFFISACGEKEAPYISEDKMLNVLRELHLADVLTEGNGGSLGWRHAIRNEHYDEVLENFELSRPEFYRSYTHYLDNPEIMDSIYVRLIKDIENRMDGVRINEYEMGKDQAKWEKEKKNKLKKGTETVKKNAKKDSE